MITKIKLWYLERKRKQLLRRYLIRDLYNGRWFLRGQQQLNEIDRAIDKLLIKQLNNH